MPSKSALLLPSVCLLVAAPALAEQPKKARSGVRGTVTDARTGEALIEATVRVVSGGAGQTLTDIDGGYTLRLEPGTYDLRVFYELYEGRRLSGVVVEPGEVLELDVALEPDDDSVQEILVEAKADTRKEAAVLQERRKAAVVSDAISAQEISRTPDSSAGDAVKRVVSATVVGGRYVFLRGLGGRYSQTLLNGVQVPSPEPDEQAVPLDMFPTGLLSSLNVAKTYSADLPGTFAGGALLIETNSYPSKQEWKLKLSLSGNSETTFQERNSHAGGPLDFLGFDAGSRSLPDAVPSDRMVSSGSMKKAERAEVGRAFSPVWSAGKTLGLPNASFSASTGNTHDVGGGKLGYLASVQLAHRESMRRDTTARAQMQEGEITGTSLPPGTVGREGGTVGGLLNVGYQPTPGHDFGLLALYTHAGDASTFVKEGYSKSDGADSYSSRLLFEERALTFTQLTGSHDLPAGIDLRWQGNYALTTRSEPDTRDIYFRLLDDGTRVYRVESATRFFSELTDHSGGGGADVSIPLPGLKLHAGATAQLSSRAFTARRFRMEQGSRPDTSLYRRTPEEMFAPENMGDTFLPQEETNPEDVFRAASLVAAGFLSADVSVLDPVRVIAGLRYEFSDQRLWTVDLGTGASPQERAARTVGHVLPTVNAVWSLASSMNLRAGYSYTLARPQFRELAPFLYFDFVRQRAISGEPGLVESRIHNADLRWEWFPGESEVVAASVFHKQFRDPIEVVAVNAEGDLSMANARGAQNTGIELEGRVGLGRLASVLEPLRAGANLSLIHSRIELDPAKASIQSSSERPMQGQSPWVVNANVTWTQPNAGTEISLLYNVAGARIAEVGIETRPDVYEQPVHRLDLSVSQPLPHDFKLSLTATNLLNQSFVLKSGSVEELRYQPGVSGGLSLEWSP